MRTLLLFFALVILAFLGYFGYAHLSGGAVPTFGLPLGGQKAQVRKLCEVFFEDIKFKNTEKLEEFIDKSLNPEKLQDYLIEIFDKNPKSLSIEKMIINSIEIDSQGQRARVKIKIIGNDLSQNIGFEKNKIIFLYFDILSKRWLIDIKNLIS